MVAAQQPLMILLDTGEVIGDRAWGWLRRLTAHTGPRVAWVVGARFETEAEAGADSPVAQFVREVGDEHLMLMSPTRFDDMMIRSYLEHRYAVRTYRESEIDLIAGFTRGLPLAVSFAATLLDQGQPVQDACQEFDDGQPSNAVSRLARRYLVHAEQQIFPEDDPRRQDVMRILGLALAFGDVRKDPEVLAALWNVEPGTHRRRSPISPAAMTSCCPPHTGCMTRYATRYAPIYSTRSSVPAPSKSTRGHWHCSEPG